ncbi:MAG: hypothetical protein NVS3B21_28590 [Acidimicrobiales bacterium]
MAESSAALEFKTFGYTVLRHLLSHDEVIELRAEVERGLRDRFGTTFGHNTRDDMPGENDDEVAAEGNFMPLMSNLAPLSQRLVADDRRLTSFAESVLGECTIASPALATLLTSDTPWHSDPGIGERWLRFNAYLQPAAATTGALRAVPASHHGSVPAGVAALLKSDPRRQGKADGLPGVVLETEPGDVIAFDPRVHHSAWGGGARLRWSIDFAAFPAIDDHDRRERTRDLVDELSSWPTDGRWPTWAEWAAGGTTDRARALNKLIALGVSGLP